MKAGIVAAAAAVVLSLLSPGTARADGLAGAAAGVGAQVPDPAQTPVSCPAQSGKTMVALLLGQSNAANHSDRRNVAGPAAVSLFDGKCYAAADPLPGGSGDGGSLWPPLADRLVKSGRFDRVVLVPAAINGAGIARWAPGGDLEPWLTATVASLAGRYRVTHVFWLQGETDLLLETSAAAYQQMFHALQGRLRALGVDAPVHLTVSSGYCGRPKMGVPAPPGNPVATAQRALIAAGRGVCGGPDTDALLAQPGDRHDGCHMSGQGADKLATAWAALLTGRARSIKTTKESEFACPGPRGAATTAQ
jgi:hypothetical protein